MLSQSPLYSKVTQFYIYIYIFKIFFSIMIYLRRMDEVLCIIQQNLLIYQFYM